MAKQLGFFVTSKIFPAVPCMRLQSKARRALAQYGAGAALPSFALRTLAEEQARLELLRAAGRRLARRATGRASKLGRAELAASPAGARIGRMVAATVKRIEQLEATLLCACAGSCCFWGS